MPNPNLNLNTSTLTQTIFRKSNLLISCCTRSNDLGTQSIILVRHHTAYLFPGFFLVLPIFQSDLFANAMANIRENP